MRKDWQLNDEALRIKVPLTDANRCPYGSDSAYAFRSGFHAFEVKTPFWQPAYTEQYAQVFLLAGSGLYRDETGIERALKPGQLFERLPGRLHQTRWEPGELQLCYLAVPATLYRSIQLAGGLVFSQPVHDLGHNEAIPQTVYEIMQSMKRQIHAVSAESQLKIYRHLLQVSQWIESLYAPQKGQEWALVEEACYHLNSAVEKQLPIPELLAPLNLSYSRVRQLFAKHLKQSPGNYRINVRIDHAKFLLTDYGKSVKEVAALMDYPDVPTFSRQFKKVTGLPPSRFQIR